MKNISAIILVVMFALFSCGAKKTKESQQKTPNKILLNDSWHLTHINNSQVQTKAHLEFDTQNNKVFGNDGCNNVTGALTSLTNTSINFGTIAATRMLCEDMSVADKFGRLLNNVSFYKIEDLQLFLLDSQKNNILTFKKGD